MVSAGHGAQRDAATGGPSSPETPRRSTRAPHWAGEAEVAWERAAEDEDWRRQEDEAEDARRLEPHTIYDDHAGREY